MGLRSAIAAVALGCAPRVGGHAPRVVPAPIAVRDGQVVTEDGPIRIGLVAGFATAGDALRADLEAADLAFVVLATDAVERGTASAHRDLHERLGRLPALPIPGDGEARGDRHLRNWTAAWSGLGSAETGRPVPWRAFELVASGHPWQIVVLDAEQERLGSLFADQTFWLPRVCRSGDAPLVVLTNQSVGEPGGAALHGLLRRHAPATRLALIAAGGTDTLELTLPGGQWGEGWLDIGRAGVVGWWLLVLDGETLSLTLRTKADETGWSPSFTTSWTRDEGWATTP